MADTLLFRGGPTADINSAATTVADREIVIDTDTNEIVVNSTKKRLATQGNAVDFGSATFSDDIACTDNSKGLILKSPDGTNYRITVANGGTLSISAV